MALAVSLSACSATKNLKEGEYLLVKNEVSANRKEIPVQSEIIYLVKPAANQRFLGIYPLRAAIYQSMLPKEQQKDRTWKQWFRNNLGEEPKLMDSASVSYSCQQIQQYLYNKGYFESAVQSDIQTRHKKAVVRYHITAEEPYLLNESSYQIKDTAIYRLVRETEEYSLLKKGMPYDADLLRSERNRIANLLSNHGYYLFRPEHIRYKVDSNLNSHKFNLTVCIGEEEGAASGNQLLHPFRTYHIHRGYRPPHFQLYGKTEITASLHLHHTIAKRAELQTQGTHLSVVFPPWQPLFRRCSEDLLQSV